MKPFTLAKIVFSDNYMSVLCNIERIKWSLQYTSEVIDYNPDLIDEFEYIFEFDKDVDDFDDKIIESLTLISKQHFILMMSYYEYYLYFIKALLDRENDGGEFSDIFTEILNSKQKLSIKDLGKRIELENNSHFENINKEFSELRNAMIHRNSKAIKGSIVVLKSFINDSYEVNLDYDKTITLIYKVAEFVDEIDQMVISVFPKLNMLIDE